MTKKIMSLRKSLIALVGAGTLAVDSRADILNLSLKNSQVNQPFASVTHTIGATTGLDLLYDIDRIHPTLANKLDIYSQIPGHDLQVNALPANDFSPVTNRVDGLSLTSPVNVNLQTSINFENGEFDDKKLNLDVYCISNSIPVLKGTYNARSMTNLANSVPLTVNNGYSYDLVFRPTPILRAQCSTNDVPAETSLFLDLSGSGGQGSLIYKIEQAPNLASGTLEQVVGGITNQLTDGSTLLGSNVVFRSKNNVYGEGAGTFTYSVFDGVDTSVGTNFVNVIATKRAPYFTNSYVTNGTDMILEAMVQPNRTLNLLGKESLSDTNWNVLAKERVPVNGYGPGILSPSINPPAYTKKVYTLPMTNSSAFYNLESVSD